MSSLIVIESGPIIDLYWEFLGAFMFKKKKKKKKKKAFNELNHLRLTFNNMYLCFSTFFRKCVMSERWVCMVKDSNNGGGK